MEVGVPAIVSVVPTNVAVTPLGKPVALTPVAPPPMEYVMGAIALVKQIV